MKAGLTTVFTRFSEGDSDLNSVDNLGFQPGSGSFHGIEDHPSGVVWTCLPGCADRNLKSDGRIRILPVKDADAGIPQPNVAS